MKLLRISYFKFLFALCIWEFTLPNYTCFLVRIKFVAKKKIYLYLKCFSVKNGSIQISNLKYIYVHFPKKFKSLTSIGVWDLLHLSCTICFN